MAEKMADPKPMELKPCEGHKWHFNGIVWMCRKNCGSWSRVNPLHHQDTRNG